MNKRRKHYIIFYKTFYTGVHYTLKSYGNAPQEFNSLLETKIKCLYLFTSGKVRECCVNRNIVLLNDDFIIK